MSDFLFVCRHGHGEHIFADGSVYTGEFEFDVRCGKGNLKSIDGELYEGVRALSVLFVACALFNSLSRTQEH